MAKPSSKVLRAWIVQYAALFLDILTAIVRNDENAVAFAEFQASAQKLTKQQLHTVASYASEYYVQRANPSPGKLSEKKIGELTKKAIREALERLAHDNQQ